MLAETADSPRDDYDRVMAINLRGAWSCMKFELRQMREQGSGAIVNCSSLGGLIGGNQRGTYHAAKHGVIGFTKSAALEYATRGIRVNGPSFHDAIVALSPWRHSLRASRRLRCHSILHSHWTTA